MLRELIHLARHAPAALLLKRRLDKIRLYDAVMTRADESGFGAWRSWLAEGLSGDVLEIGCGTGFMFARYPKEARVRAIEHWLRLNEQGCHMDRDTVATVREVFGDVELLARFQIFAPGVPAFPMVALRARKRD